MRRGEINLYTASSIIKKRDTTPDNASEILLELMETRYSIYSTYPIQIQRLAYKTRWCV